MEPTQLARCEVRRRQGFGRFALTFGLLRVGSAILALELIVASLALIGLRGVIRSRGAVPSVRVSDYFQIILQLGPLLFAIAVAAGLLSAGAIWFSWSLATGGRASARNRAPDRSPPSDAPGSADVAADGKPSGRARVRR